MKKALLTAIIVLIVLSSLIIVTTSINLVSAISSQSYYTIPPPTISVESPNNITVYSCLLPLNFTIDYTPSGSGGVMRNDLTGISYSIDCKPFTNISPSPSQNISIDISNLSNGKHQIEISTSFFTQLWVNAPGSNDYLSAPIYFSVYNTKPPVISNLSVENKTYTTTQIPLNFNVNKTTSWIGYSLDNQENVTLYGNTTLHGLLAGYHTLVLYANDTAGNVGKSDTVEFTIQPNLPAPSSSPTQQPTLEPSPTPNNTQEDFTPIIIITSIVIAAVIVGLLAYLAKYKGWK